MNLDILTIITLVPIFTGLILIILPQLLPKETADNLKLITRKHFHGSRISNFCYFYNDFYWNNR